MSIRDYTRKAAWRYWKADLSVLPIAADGSKQPYFDLLPRKNGKAGWAVFADRLPTKDEMHTMFPVDRPMGAAIIAGAVSDDLEIIDIDDGDTWTEYRQQVEREAPGLLAKIPRVKSPRPGGGRHLYVFSDCAGGCCVLAADRDGETLIEVKGEGGYCLAPGSHPKCHSTGREYEHVASTPKITAKPKVTDEERSILFACAVALNRYDGDVDDEDGPTERTATPDSPGNVFMARETFVSSELLEKHGWRQLGQYGDRVAWARPGREDKPGFSALSGPDRHGHDRLMVFSTAAAPLKAGKSYNVFQASAALECKGNFRRAALRLAERGYAKDAVSEIETLPLSSRPLLWRPAPLDVLPDPIGKYIENTSTTIGADAGFLIGPVLAQLAGAIGNSRRMRLKRGWTEPAVVWAAFLASSGSLKSPAMDHGKRHLEQIHREAAREYRIAKEEYAQQRRDYEEELRSWRRAKKGDMPVPPEAPVPVSFMIDNITIESVIEKLSQNPRGLLLATDELAGWLLAMNQYRQGKGADVQHWLSMHGSRSIKCDRKGQEPVFVPHAAVSIVGPVPPEVFKQVVGRQHFEDGLVPRFLTVMPPESPKRWSEADISPKLDRQMQSLVRKLTELPLEQDDHGDPVPALIDLDPDARQAWIEWYNQHGVRQRSADGYLKAAYSKLEAYCARFALIFHLVRAVRRGGVDAIALCDMQRAIRLVEWFVHETQRVYAILQAGEDDAELIKIAEVVQKRGGETTVRQLRDSGPRELRGDAEMVEERLNRLVEKGWGKWHRKNPGSKGGRPTRVFKLNAVDAKPSNTSGNRRFRFQHPGSERCADAVSGEEIEELVL